jgi:hypothetical protein
VSPRSPGGETFETVNDTAKAKIESSASYAEAVEKITNRELREYLLNKPDVRNVRFRRDGYVLIQKAKGAYCLHRGAGWLVFAYGLHEAKSEMVHDIA